MLISIHNVLYIPGSEFEREFDKVSDGRCHRELEEGIRLCEGEVRLRLAVGG